MKKPIIEVRKIEESIYGYAVYRNDQPSPIIRGISGAHARHIKHILRGMSDLPYKINPIKDWYDHDEIVDT